MNNGYANNKLFDFVNTKIMKNTNLNPLVSIVIPVYNTEKFLVKCLNSAVLQTYKDIEIIIVDDGSPDNSYLIGEEYQKKDKRISLIRQNNLGLSGARNTGIQSSRGEYILFLDSDDTLDNEAIEGLVSCIITGKTSIAIPDRYTKIFENSRRKYISVIFKDDRNIFSPVDFALEFIIGQGRAWRATAVLYDANIIRDNNIEFPLGYTAEDIVFNLSFLTKAKSIAIYRKSTLINLKRAGSITTSFSKNMLNNFLFIDNKIVDFVKCNSISEEIGNKYRYSLLCRNMILYFINIMMQSKNEPKLKTKYSNFKELLHDERISLAFSYKNKIPPFFNNRIISLFFRVEYFLIKRNLFLFAFLLIFAVEKFKKIN